MKKHGPYKFSASLTLLPRLIDVVIFQRLQDMADVNVRDVGIVIISVFVIFTALLIT
jgi:hypothetical protein